jgi:hypothetical protein
MMIADRFMDFVASGYKETPEQPVEQVMAPGQQPGDVLMAEAGSRNLPESAYSGEPPKYARMESYDPTVRETIANKMQMWLEGMGVDRYKARQNAQTFMGGGSSNLPLSMGIADIIPFIGTGLQTQESVRLGEDAMTSVKQGNYGTAAIQAGGAAVGLIPGLAGTAQVAKKLAPTAGEAVIKSMEKLGSPVMMNAVPPGPNTVSTRLPTAVKATEDPLANNLSIDFEAVKSDPEAFKYNMGLIQQYPNFASKARNPEKRAEDFIDEVKNNLLYLYDKVPEQTRERSKLWYDGARNITTKWSEQYQIPDQAVSGVLAVLSPQKDWFMNVSLGQRVLDIMGTKQTTKWDNTMSEMAKVIWSKPQYAPMVDSIKGKALDEITDPGLKAMWLRTYDQAYNPREHQIVTPEGDFAGLRMNADGKTPTKTGWGSLNEIGKAIVILEDPSKASISNNLGAMHKVRNFYNNIYAPNDPTGAVTIDTHAVAAGLLRPLSGNSREVLHNFGSGITGEGGPKNSSITGVQGTYGIYAEAYRRAAQERGVLPREMQSITWEAVRGLFPDTFKSQAKNVDQVDGIWLKYRKGQLSLDEARNEVFNAAGGINPPEWEGAGLRAGTTPEIPTPINQGELFGTSVSRGTIPRLESGKRTGTSRTVPQGNGINPGQSGQVQNPSGGIE